MAVWFIVYISNYVIVHGSWAHLKIKNGFLLNGYSLTLTCEILNACDGESSTKSGVTQRVPHYIESIQISQIAYKLL